jgi:hypothetical protein
LSLTPVTASWCTWPAFIPIGSHAWFRSDLLGNINSQSTCKSAQTPQSVPWLRRGSLRGLTPRSVVIKTSLVSDSPEGLIKAQIAGATCEVADLAWLGRGPESSLS